MTRTVSESSESLLNPVATVDQGIDGRGLFLHPRERNGTGLWNQIFPISRSHFDSGEVAEGEAMAAVPLPPPPLLASHAAVRAAASAVCRSRRARRAGDQPPQVAALRRGDWVKLICGASFEVPCAFHLASSLVHPYLDWAPGTRVRMHSRVEWTGRAASAPSPTGGERLTGRVMRLCWTFGVSLEGKIEN